MLLNIRPVKLMIFFFEFKFLFFQSLYNIPSLIINLKPHGIDDGNNN